LWANLLWANLFWANLSGANLSKADLRGADLRGADLTGTCLDPAAHVPTTDLSAFERDGDKLICYRTAKSQHSDNADYSKPGVYVSPTFSVSTETACHPGIYFATQAWIEGHYPGVAVVKGYVLASEAIKAGDKYRAKRFFSWGFEGDLGNERGELARNWSAARRRIWDSIEAGIGNDYY
jgi:Pentapeptide repeats (8 copies)